jgi:SHS family lactate transporter-like MFS transporter
MPSKGPWWAEPTRGQWVAFGAVWLGWVLDAFDFTVFLLVMPQLAQEFGTSLTATALSITLTLLVRLAGGLVAGAVADKWGRKRPLVYSVVWFAVCNGLVAVAPSFGWVLALRTLFGFGMGAEWTAGVALTMESWPARSRAIASGALQGGWAVGYLLAALASSLVMPTWGWRGLFLLGLAPAALALPMRWWVPESPEFLRAAARRAQRASATVGSAASEDAATQDSGTAIGGRAALGRALWASVVLTLGFSSYYALVSFHSTMLQRQFGLPVAQVGGPIALFNVGMLLGTLACGWLGARVGPRLAIAAFSLALLPAVPVFVQWVAAPHAVGAFLVGFTGAGTAGVTPLLLASLFPVALRARLTGLCYHLAALGAAFTPLWMAALVSEGAAYSTVVGLSAMAFAVAQAAAVWLARRSTANGLGGPGIEA